MYPRKFSLKNPYLVLKYGSMNESEHLILRALFKGDLDPYAMLNVRYKEILEGISNPSFCIIVSNKFSKKAVTKNKVKRLISKGVKSAIEKIKKQGWFVVIPKKRIVDENGKITVDVEKISSEINSLLSKMAVV